MKIEGFTSQFDPISLDEMDAVRLMNRTDTKYILSTNQFAQILPLIKEDYRILEVGNKRVSQYRSLYFDTQNYKFYMDHHNGRNSRYKIRLRKYVDSDLCFLEVKHKHKGRTIKKRIPVGDFSFQLDQNAKSFIEKTAGINLPLNPTLWNQFERITLVSKNDPERITFDIGLSYEWDGWVYGEENLVVAEVKQEEINRNSPFMKLTKQYGIRPTRVSKYCVGLIRKDPKIKYNGFKSRLLKIDRLTNGVSGC